MLRLSPKYEAEAYLLCQSIAEETAVVVLCCHFTGTSRTTDVRFFDAIHVDSKAGVFLVVVIPSGLESSRVNH